MSTEAIKEEIAKIKKQIETTDDVTEVIKLHHRLYQLQDVLEALEFQLDVNNKEEYL